MWLPFMGNCCASIFDENVADSTLMMKIILNSFTGGPSCDLQTIPETQITY
jgi:hypothetical protein